MSLQMSQKMISCTGEEHGLINTLPNTIKKEDGFKNMDEAMKTELLAKQKHENELVRARYHNYRGTNERLSKPYCHWAGDPIQYWNFIPGEEYVIPRGLAEEVNDKNKFLAKRSEVLDVNGVPTKKDGHGERIHEFLAVGF